ncbi:MAG: helix-turn-helix transcriptional regulator [Clostridia bacterium]|nr:helix-turn-helix transcriptional regulator [Clostridia bacterium]
MFYDKYAELCSEKGVSPTKAAEDMGIGRATVSRWKNSGSSPVARHIDLMVEYFAVSADYLLGNTDIKSPQPTSEDDELLLLLDELRNRPDMKMLFSVSKKCTPEEVRQAVKIIEALRKDDSDSED